MGKTKSLLLCGLLLVLLSACGRQHRAESVVNGFIEANAASDGCSAVFSPLDSTDRITAGRIAAMKISAKSDPLFKRGVVYGAVPADGRYAYMRAKIINGADTVVRTFYLDAALTHVVAFKEN